jgi:transcriptional regulator with XRE-family HTH domain
VSPGALITVETRLGPQEVAAMKRGEHTPPQLLQTLETFSEDPVEIALRLFGRRVRTARKTAKLTIERASERAEIDPVFLGEIERGRKRPSFETIFAVAAALGVAPIFFFQFDRAETDPAILRRRIEAVLEHCTPPQLLQAYRLLQSVVEP